MNDRTPIEEYNYCAQNSDNEYLNKLEFKYKNYTDNHQPFYKLKQKDTFSDHFLHIDFTGFDSQIINRFTSEKNCGTFDGIAEYIMEIIDDIRIREGDTYWAENNLICIEWVRYNSSTLLRRYFCRKDENSEWNMIDNKEQYYNIINKTT